MLIKSFQQLVALALTIGFTNSAFTAGNTQLHQVYLTAESGKFNEPQPMMDKVLNDYPNSAKAYFIEAELLAKQGRKLALRMN